MNKMINKFLLARDKFIPEMYLRQPGFIYSACGPFTENKERIENSRKQNSRYIYQNELGKACFQHDMAYGNFKDLLEEQLLIKYYVIKHLILLKFQNIVDVKEVLLRWFLNIWIKASIRGRITQTNY